MDRSRRLPALPALVTFASLALAFGCAGPPIAAPIDGIPVCPDFTLGHARMEGSLRHPVRLRVMDGKTLLYRTIIDGLRHPEDPGPRSFISDDNAKFTVEWAQCSNERAPRSAADVATEKKDNPKPRDKARDKAREKAREGEGTAYDCGEVKIYKADGVLETKKGDRASHVIHFLPPPDTTCWVDEAVAPPPGAGDTNAPDAGAAPAAETDAGPAIAMDAGVISATDAGSVQPTK
jgi:hypothetical protein